MRLIDANILELDADWDKYEDGFTAYSEMQIDNAETVKAIPLDRVEQIRAEIESRLQGVNIALDVLAKDHALIPRMEGAKITLEELLEIIDKALKALNE